MRTLQFYKYIKKLDENWFYILSENFYAKRSHTKISYLALIKRDIENLHECNVLEKHLLICKEIEIISYLVKTTFLKNV